MNEKHTHMKEHILGKIRGHELRMRPRFLFSLQLLVTVFIAVVALAFAILIFNYIFFSIRVGAQDALLGFGARGFRAFLRFFPWGLLALDALLILALQLLVRQFRFGWRTPLLHLIGAGLAFAALFGFLLDRATPLNDMLLRRADERGLPQPFRGAYARVREWPPRESGICRCLVTAIDGSIVSAEDVRTGETLTILLPENDARATTTDIEAGDFIVVAGDLDDGILQAFGLREVPRERAPWRAHPRPLPLQAE